MPEVGLSRLQPELPCLNMCDTRIKKKSRFSAWAFVPTGGYGVSNTVGSQADDKPYFGKPWNLKGNAIEDRGGWK
jgi:hypothetical protein